MIVFGVGRPLYQSPRIGKCRQSQPTRTKFRQVFNKPVFALLTPQWFSGSIRTIQDLLYILFQLGAPTAAAAAAARRPPRPRRPRRRVPPWPGGQQFGGEDRLTEQ